jgi:hypothetical protein
MDKDEIEKLIDERIKKVVGQMDVLPDAIKERHLDLTDGIKVDTISEKTSGSGVTIDSFLIKDGGFDLTSDAQGDIYYRGASALARLAAGTSGQYLKTQGSGANPTWASVSTTISIKFGQDTTLDNANFDENWTDVYSVAITTTETSTVIALTDFDVRSGDGNEDFRVRILRDAAVISGQPYSNLVGANLRTHLGTAGGETGLASGSYTFKTQAMNSTDTDSLTLGSGHLTVITIQDS